MVILEYPHSVTITRDNDDGFSDSEIVTIYDGECDAQVGTGGGFGESSFVSDSDYTVFTPTVDVEVKRGDKVSIAINPSWSVIKGEVKQVEVSFEFGTTLWVTEYGNQ